MRVILIGVLKRSALVKKYFTLKNQKLKMKENIVKGKTSFFLLLRISSL